MKAGEAIAFFVLGGAFGASLIRAIEGKITFFGLVFLMIFTAVWLFWKSKDKKTAK